MINHSLIALNPSIHCRLKKIGTPQSGLIGTELAKAINGPIIKSKMLAHRLGGIC